MSNHLQPIKILVDSDSEVQIKGALPGIPKLVPKLIEMQVEDLQAKLEGCLVSLLSTLDSLTLGSEKFETYEISFSLNIGLSGEISLVSLAKGAATGGAGIQFVVRPKPATDAGGTAQ